MTSFGPSLPPHLLKQRQEQEEEEKKAESVGPALPPHLLESRKRKAEEEDNDEKKEEPKNEEKEPQPPVKRRVIGPSLEDLVKDDAPAEEEEEEEEARPVVGPLPASDPRARKPEKARPNYIVTPSFALDGQDRRETEKGKKKNVGPAKATPLDSAQKSLMETYNKNHRSESLVAKHIQKVNAKKEATKQEEKDEWRPWDKEKDLAFRPMSAQAVNSVLKKAKELDTRFSHQSGSRFL